MKNITKFSNQIMLLKDFGANIPELDKILTRGMSICGGYSGFAVSNGSIVHVERGFSAPHSLESSFLRVLRNAGDLTSVAALFHFGCCHATSSGSVDSQPIPVSTFKKNRKRLMYDCGDVVGVCSEKHQDGFLFAWDAFVRDGLSIESLEDFMVNEEPNLGLLRSELGAGGSMALFRENSFVTVGIWHTFDGLMITNPKLVTIQRGADSRCSRCGIECMRVESYVLSTKAVVCSDCAFQMTSENISLPRRTCTVCGKKLIPMFFEEGNICNVCNRKMISMG